MSVTRSQCRNEKYTGVGADSMYDGLGDGVRSWLGYATSHAPIVCQVYQRLGFSSYYFY